MMDTVLNLLFRCSHRRITRPITPVAKTGEPHGGTYVVCLDCGKQFDYDTAAMKVGRPIERAEGVGVLPPDMPGRRKSKVAYALLAAAPVAVALGIVLKGRKREDAKPAETTPSEPRDRESAPR